MQSFLDIFISINCVSGGSSAHYQEHKTAYTASGIVKPILLPVAIMDEMERTLRKIFIEINRSRKSLHLFSCILEIQLQYMDI
jgi:hypothetical protein